MSRYCLPDSTSLYSYNPETSSRVTLATLGTVFQTELHHLMKSVISVIRDRFEHGE
ncbi:MAG: hypothetical protein ACI4CB_09655 [Prevotella sp.]|nr:hypothetical protein [Prevotella sp.]MCI7269336.1 hypothetical protein [Prevotella sp.]